MRELSVFNVHLCRKEKAAGRKKILNRDFLIYFFQYFKECALRVLNPANLPWLHWLTSNDFFSIFYINLEKYFR